MSAVSGIYAIMNLPINGRSSRTIYTAGALAASTDGALHSSGMMLG